MARVMSAGNMISLLWGASTTVLLSLAAILLGIPLGLGLAVARWTRLPVLRQIVIVIVSLFRATPAVTTMLLFFFVLPTVGIPVNAVAAALLTLTINTAAFNSEIWRAALEEFPREQMEAAKSIGMRASQRFYRIVLPQIFRASLPALVNEMTLLVKASPAIAVVGVVDITRAAARIGAETYDPLPPFLIAFVFYGAFVFVFVKLHRTIEGRRRLQEAGL
jgi:His/Glu/Gln/Arg/opine family amino acid ABC transporter permease subunit